MNNYCCPNCNRKFTKKCHLDDHLTKKKKPCIVAEIQIFNADEIPQNNAQNCINPTKIPPNPTKIPPNYHQNPPSCNMQYILDDNLHKDSVINIRENKCTYCNKLFSRFDSLQRHLKDRCPYKKLNDNNNNLVIQTLMEEVTLLKELLQKDSSSNTINSNNTMNNSNNKTNVQNIQVNISGFGKEDLKKLDIKEAMNVYLKSTGGNIIPNMLGYINLNKNYPENHNICITDKSREFVKIHNGQKYVYKKFKNAKFDIVDSVVDNINGIVDIYNDGNYKKSEDINKKININGTSLKLISGEELVESEEESNTDSKIVNVPNNDFTSDTSEDIINDLKNMDKNIQNMINNKEKISRRENNKINLDNLNSKKEGLQKLTYEKLKDELYNARTLLP